MPYTYSWSVSPSAGTSFSDNTALNPTLTCANPGSYVVTFQANDGTNSASDTAVVNVSDPPVVIPSPPANSIVVDETAFTFVDAGGIFATATGGNLYNGAEEWAPGENNATANPTSATASGYVDINMALLQQIEIWEYHRSDKTDRSAVVPFTLVDAGSQTLVSSTIDQSTGTGGEWVPLGIWNPTIAGNVRLTISNTGIGDFMAIDAIAYRLTTIADTTPPIISSFTATANGTEQIDLHLEAAD